MLQLSQGCCPFSSPRVTTPSIFHEFDLLFFTSLVIHLAGSPSMMPLWNWLSLDDLTVISLWLGQTWAVQPLHQVSSATRQDCAVRLFDDLVGMAGWVGNDAEVVEVDKLRWFCAKEKVRIQSKVYTYSSINDSPIHHLRWLGSLWIIQMNQFATVFFTKRCSKLIDLVLHHYWTLRKGLPAVNIKNVANISTLKSN